ncbi:hypothetical protein RJG79_04840 [Mycoplasmatota bacterium WC44]
MVIGIFIGIIIFVVGLYIYAVVSGSYKGVEVTYEEIKDSCKRKGI